MKNKITNIIGIILISIACINIAITLVGYEIEIDHQNKHIQLLQGKLNDSRDEVKYYQKQYKKYYELSEELENQLGVYPYD